MFKNIFRKKNHKIQNKQESEISFLGSPYGEDALRLEGDIAERLKTVLPIKRAYLSMVHYVEDENARLALVIESDVSKIETIPLLVKACADMIPMDILFFEDLSEQNHSNATSKCKKFYHTGSP